MSGRAQSRPNKNIGFKEPLDCDRGDISNNNYSIILNE